MYALNRNITPVNPNPSRLLKSPRHPTLGVGTNFAAIAPLNTNLHYCSQKIHSFKNRGAVSSLDSSHFAEIKNKYIQTIKNSIDFLTNI